MFGRSLRSRVIKAINKKIDEAEKEYAKDLVDLNEKLKSSLKTLRFKYLSDKIAITEKHVNGLLSKII